MFLESNFTETFEVADRFCKEKLALAMKTLVPSGPDLRFETFDDLYSHECYLDHAFFIEEGAVSQQLYNRTLFHHDTGDIIGLDLVDGAPRSLFSAQAPVTLRPYKRDELWQQAFSNTASAQAWCEYLLAECGRHTCVIASQDAPMDKASPGFQTYSTGDVIIEEGTESDSVYSIVEGHAEVFVKGVKVGEVLEDEIFGALSLLTNSPRTATVVADGHCLVMVVPRAQFQSLLQTHPRICLSLMENMARQIVDLNYSVSANQSRAV